MDRIWLKNYPPGVPAEIDPSTYPSLIAIFEESFQAHRGKQAFICMGSSITFDELDRASSALGAWLQSKGLKRGARVAIKMPNTLQYPIALLGILRAGYTVVNVNPLYTPRELEFQLKDSGAEAIIVLENFAHTLAHVIAKTGVKHVVVSTMGDLLGLVKGTIVNFVIRHGKKMVPPYSLPGAHKFNDVIAQGRGMTLQKPMLGPDDIAFLQYTGGTTGVSKGATLSHRNVVANTMQAYAWLQPALMQEPRVPQLFMVAALPLSHIFALTACALIGVRLGGVCLLIPNPRDIAGLIKELSKYKVNFFPAVNTLFNAMLNHPDFGKIDWSQLKSTVGGGMAVQRSVAERWLKATGKPIIEAYGLSETSPGATANRCDITEWTGTIGYPFPSTDIKILDVDDKEMALGEAGEIAVRGPQVMVGYWNRPDETAKVMTADGFFRTGDIGIMTAEGQVKIVDRKKDMISVSGFKVFPNEVEDVAMMQGNIVECAAVGVPDPHSGEAVKLFAVSKSPELTADELRRFMHGKLAAYKLPKHIEFRHELPKTNVGKILRRALRDNP
ncbi:MAG: long-chain-fatty-acid--CoA ligase [Pseudolabrys sp.]|nr:long-chain-fatty-acid--CoA ligase [Pseudolabrys sp.]MDP2296398.1 long-chain-fatty-acid--CoA ligase [Pseudolabrys sp.]